MQHVIILIMLMTQAAPQMPPQKSTNDAQQLCDGELQHNYSVQGHLCEL